MNINAAGSRELITFLIGKEEFSVDIMSIREIRGWTQATLLPNAPSFVRGVINLRGAVLSIIDLAERLGFPPAVPTARHVIIVVQIGNQVAGLLVDAVTGILTVKPDSILPTPDVASDLARNFIKGMMAIDNRMISLIGLDYVLPSQNGQGSGAVETDQQAA
jgi:purine-binding chemotaxis protein CheW